MGSGDARGTTEDTDAARQIAETRWPDGARCPFCNSQRVFERTRNRPGRRWPQWRCRDCRKEFTAVTGTTLHGTRRTPTEVTRQYSSLPEALGLPVSDVVGAESRKHEDLTADMSAAARNVLNALRQRPDGATIAKIAEIAGVSDRHARRTLQYLAAGGLAGVRDGIVRDGHRPLHKPLWRLTYSPECVRLLGCLPRQRAAMPEMPVAGVVPPQFWHLFWSGSQGSEVTLAEDEPHIAGALIGSLDLSAEAWALRNLSTETLESIAGLRGYETGDVNTLVRSELGDRTRVAS